MATKCIVTAESHPLLARITSSSSCLCQLQEGYIFKSWSNVFLTLRGNILILRRMGSAQDELIPLDSCLVTPVSNQPGVIKLSGKVDYVLLFEEPEKWLVMLTGRGRSSTVALKNFKVVRSLGKGGYAEVILVQHRSSGHFYAMKVVRKQRRYGKRYMRAAWLIEERSALEILDHPYIATLKYAFQDKYAWYMCMEFCPGGDVFDFTHRRKKRGQTYSLSVVRLWLAQIVSALQHMHRQGWVHRDLKLENLLLDHLGHLRITDFGLAKRLLPERAARLERLRAERLARSSQASSSPAPSTTNSSDPNPSSSSTSSSSSSSGSSVSSTRPDSTDSTAPVTPTTTTTTTTTAKPLEGKGKGKLRPQRDKGGRLRTYSFCGTDDYLAPEMIQRTGHGVEVDWWALGVIMFELVVGRPPWRATKHKTKKQAIVETPLRFPVPKDHGSHSQHGRHRKRTPSRTHNNSEGERQKEDEGSQPTKGKREGGTTNTTPTQHTPPTPTHNGRSTPTQGDEGGEKVMARDRSRRSRHNSARRSATDTDGYYDPHWKSLVKQLLCKDAVERCGHAAIIRDHAFFAGICWEEVDTKTCSALQLKHPNLAPCSHPPTLAPPPTSLARVSREFIAHFHLCKRQDNDSRKGGEDVAQMDLLGFSHQHTWTKDGRDEPHGLRRESKGTTQKGRGRDDGRFAIPPPARSSSVPAKLGGFESPNVHHNKRGSRSSLGRRSRGSGVSMPGSPILGVTNENSPRSSNDSAHLSNVVSTSSNHDVTGRRPRPAQRSVQPELDAFSANKSLMVFSAW